MLRKTILLITTPIFTVGVVYFGSAFASDYGVRGLIDIPVARMREDGTFTTTISHDSYAESYAITYQAFPWLEGSFRYTGIPGITVKKFGDYGTWDRNFEFKAQLLKETEWLPEVAVGIRDLAGTGVFSSEYLVGTKAWNNFDFTLGLGWGRLAGEGDFKNPFSLLTPAFNSRSHDTGQGGTFSVTSFFRGEKVGLFGGVEYSFDDVPVSLQVEYNPDLHSREIGYGLAQPASPISVGVNWQFNDDMTLSLTHQYGEHIGLRFHAYFDTTAKPLKRNPSPMLVQQKANASGQDLPDWYDPFMRSSYANGVFVESARLVPETHRAEVALNRGLFGHVSEAINHTHVQANQFLPDDIHTVDYIVKEMGLTLQTVRVPLYDKASTVGMPSQSTEVEFSTDTVLMPPRIESDEAIDFLDVYESDISLTAFVNSRFLLMDPDNPFAYQLYAGLGTVVPVWDDWNLVGIYQLNLTDNLDGNVRANDSVLAHVRTDSREYLKQTDHGFSHLYLEKRGSLTSELHSRVFAGVLEQMYSGVGGEMLYQPYDSRFAAGLSGAYVKQRAFDGSLSHRDYEVFTGFGSLYWATPWYNYDAALHLGRYLAKDLGGTFEVRRTFENGWAMGMWATLTDVPFEDFGEGSFDKGIYLQIPIGQTFAGGVGSEFRTSLRPTQRDGGARLEGYSGQLWWDTRKARSDVLLDLY